MAGINNKRVGIFQKRDQRGRGKNNILVYCRGWKNVTTRVLYNCVSFENRLKHNYVLEQTEVEVLSKSMRFQDLLENRAGSKR